MMKLGWLAGLSLGVAIAATSFDAAAQAKVSKQFITINGTKYRRNGADGVSLGAAGLRRDAGKNTFESQSAAPKHFKFKVKAPTEVTIDFKNTASADLGVSYQGVGVEASFAQMKQGNLKLAKFEIDRREYVKAINANKRWLEEVRDIDKDGKLRIVSAVWVLMSGEEFNSFKASGNVNYSGNGVTAKVGASGGSEAKFSFKKDSIMAYAIDFVDWEKGSPKTRKIDNLTEDKVGGI